MRDNSGSVIGEAPPLDRTNSRQLTIDEYATIKNSQDGLKSRVSDAYLKRSSIIGDSRWGDGPAFMPTSRLKPDSAH